MEFKPGVYEHFKGGLYRALVLAQHHHETNRKFVVYVSLQNGLIYTREYDHGASPWNANVQKWLGLADEYATVPRFRFLHE